MVVCPCLAVQASNFPLVAHTGSKKSVCAPGRRSNQNAKVHYSIVMKMHQYISQCIQLFSRRGGVHVCQCNFVNIVKRHRTASRHVIAAGGRNIVHESRWRRHGLWLTLIRWSVRLHALARHSADDSREWHPFTHSSPKTK